jgi:hypothetical protein
MGWLLRESPARFSERVLTELVRVAMGVFRGGSTFTHDTLVEALRLR